jgi:hypothetical protein
VVRLRFPHERPCRHEHPQRTEPHRAPDVDANACRARRRTPDANTDAGTDDTVTAADAVAYTESDAAPGADTLARCDRGRLAIDSSHAASGRTGGYSDNDRCDAHPDASTGSNDSAGGDARADGGTGVE